MNVKALVETIKANKVVILKKTAIIAGSAAALVLTAGFLAGRASEDVALLAVDEVPTLDDIDPNN